MKKLFFILILTTTLAFSQQEASVWYFGQNAGLKFNTDGSVTPLSDGQLNTSEGCSSMSDSNGNLLMYTDGRTVWDRNHIPMPNGSFANGTELFGDGSSTNSGIIIPNPGSPNIYYIFTVDEPHHQNAAIYPNQFSGTYVETNSGQTPTDDDGFNNGFNYSVVDLNVVGANGSIGDVVTRNNHLVTYDPNPAGEEIKFKCSEKVTAIKNESDNTYWVVTQFINRFYAFKVSASGVSSSPVVSTAGFVQATLGYRSNAIGCMKISPDGSKLAIAHQQASTTPGEVSFTTGLVQLFDFDIATGQVSDPITLIAGVMPYGVEFSPNSERLYATYRNGLQQNMELTQWDLTAANIPASAFVIFNQFGNLKSLQLAPNNKIYCATSNIASLGVINDPDALQMACNYVNLGQPIVGSTFTRSGLPPFVTSFFDASFQVSQFCFGTPTQFHLNSSQAVTSIQWDFGDGSPISSVINPTHQYAAPGDYTVTVTATGASGTVTKFRNIVISPIPVIATSVTAQSVCGTTGTTYDLSQHSNTLLGSQSLTDIGIAYFATLTDATTHTNELAAPAILQLGNNVFFAKVYDLDNRACHSIDNFTVTLHQSPSANPVPDIFVCDDASNNAQATFNLGQNSATALGTQSQSQFQVTYHANQADAGAAQNQLPLSYQNQSNPQVIYYRVSNTQDPACYITGSFQIGLYTQPIANPVQPMYACNSSGTSHEVFDLNMQTAGILGSQPPTAYTVSYHSSQTDALSGVNELPSSFTNTSNPQTIFVRIENTGHPECFATTAFPVNVKPLPQINLSDTYSICQGHPITITAPSGFDSYLWSNAATGNSISVSAGGNYSLTVTKDYGDIICTNTKDFIVYESGIATITQIEIIDWTPDQNSITIITNGLGDYEFAIDNGPYQDSNVFNDLSSGPHTVYVRDKRECGIIDDEVFLLTYPKFFTPNGDGNNDVWQIKFSYEEPDMEIEIYDRYGKFIKNFSGMGFGWDGTLNGQPLFSDDYWFVVKRQNGKVYRGHFSLKR